MKKYFLVTLIVLSMVLVQGCGNSSSKDNDAAKSVTAFMDNIIEGNFEKAYDNLEAKVEDGFFDDVQNNPMMDLLFGQLKYEVVESKMEDETATVKLKVTHPKLDGIIASLMSSAAANLANQDGDAKTSEEVVQDAINEATDGEEIAMEETEVEIELKLVDDKWVISEDCDLTGILGVK